MAEILMFALNRRKLIGAAIGGVISLPAKPLHAEQKRVFKVSDFGAVGDGSVNDAAAFQRAIDKAASAGGGTVKFGPGIYSLHLSAGPAGLGACAFTMRSNVMLEGADRDRSILRLADNQLGEGTFLRIIASEGELSNSTLSNFTLEGNSKGQGEHRNDANGGGIVLGWGGRCENVLVDGVSVKEINGQGIMLLSKIGDLGRALRVSSCHVSHATNIGIQSSQFDGLVIEGNTVTKCGDNGIDIYGNDDLHHSVIATSRNSLIRGNTVRHCSIGIFLETVADCHATENEVSSCRNSGLRINRINGEPRNLLVARNTFLGSKFGIAIGGDTGGVEIRNNAFVGFTEGGVYFSYNVSRVAVIHNRFAPATDFVPIVLAIPIDRARIPPEQLSFIKLGKNEIPATHSSQRMFVNEYRSEFQIDAEDLVGGRVIKPD